MGVDTDEVEKVSLKATEERWQRAFTYIRSRPELEDIVVSGGDSYQLKARQITLIGNALLEEMVWQQGLLVNDTLLEYRVPSMADLPPEQVCVIVENADGPGPFGAKGCGEGAFAGIARHPAQVLRIPHPRRRPARRGGVPRLQVCRVVPSQRLPLRAVAAAQRTQHQAGHEPVVDGQAHRPPRQTGHAGASGWSAVDSSPVVGSA